MPTVTVSLSWDEITKLKAMADIAEKQRIEDRGGSGGRPIVPASIGARLIRRGLKKNE